MTTKTLKLQIVSELKGTSGVKKTEKEFKDLNVTVVSFKTTQTQAQKKAGEYTHALVLQAEALRDLNHAQTKANTLGKVKRVATEDETRLAKAKASSAELLNLTEQSVKLEKLIISKGKNDLTVIRERNAQEAVRLKKKLAVDLAKIDAGFATGTHGNRANAQRKAALAAYRKQVLGLHREVDTANKKHIESQRRITEAKKATARQQGRVLKGTRSVIRANRSWTLQIAEGIGLYRAISFAINGISRAILAIPKIGIERQTTEAVFEATLGGGAGSAAAFKAISLEADRTGIAIGTLRETFRNLNASMSLAGETTSTVWKVFSNINTVSTALHLTADKTSNVFLALAQIFNKTKVQSEELVKQLGNLLPGAFASFQKANEAQFASSQDLIKAMAAGTVFAHETVENFTAFLADRFSTAFALASVGLQANLGRLSTAFTELGESIFAVTKGPMLSMVKGLTSIVNGIKDAVDGTGLLGVALEQLGSLAITAVALKALTLVTALDKMLGKTTAVATRFTALTKVPISAWAIIAAKAISKLGAAFRFLGGWPAVIILGIVELGGYLINLGQQARDAADRIEELISVSHRQILEAGSEATISIDVQVEGSEKVKLLKDTVKDLEQGLIDTKERTDFFSINFNPLGAEKAVKEAEFALYQANQKLENIRVSTRDDIIKEQARQSEATGKLVKQKNDSLIAITRKAKLAEQKINSIAIRKQLRQDKERYRLGLLSNKEYLDAKQKLLLQDISERTALEITKQAFSPAGSDGEKAQNKLAILKLKEEASLVKEAIAAERRQLENKPARSENKDVLAYARALSVANQELARMSDNLEEVARLQISARFDPNIATLLKNGNTELAKQLTIVKDRRIEEARVAITLDKQADLLDINRKEYELIQLSSAEFGKDAEDSLNQRIALNKEQRTIQEEQLSLLRETLETTSDELGARQQILDIEEQIAAKRKESLDSLKEVSEGGFEKALSAISGGDSIKQLDPSGFLKELEATSEARATLVNDAEQSYLSTIKNPEKKEEFEHSLDVFDIIDSGGFDGPDSDPEMIRLEEMASFKEGLQEKELDSFTAHQDQLTAISKQSNVAKLNAFGGYVLGVMDLAGQAAMAQTEASVKAYGAESKQAKIAFAQYKAIMIAKTIMATALAVMNIWGTTGIAFPVAIALTAVVAALGAVQIAQISNQQMPAAHGGLDYVPKEETYLLDKGERVLSPNQNRDLTSFLSNGEGAKSSGQASQENVKIRIINNVDNDIFNEFLESDAGERVVMNIVKRNG